MKVETYGICFGLQHERLAELSEALIEAELTVPFLDSVRDFGFRSEEFQRSFKERVDLVVLDTSYSPGTFDLKPRKGDPSSLRERLSQIEGLFPLVPVVLVTNRLLTCTKEVERLEGPPVYVTSYGFAAKGGIEGIVTSFRHFLKER